MTVPTCQSHVFPSKSPQLLVVRPFPGGGPSHAHFGPHKWPTFALFSLLYSVFPANARAPAQALGPPIFRHWSADSCAIKSNVLPSRLAHQPVPSCLADGHRDHPGSGAGHARSSWARRHHWRRCTQQQQQQQGGPAAAAAEGPDQGEDPQGRPRCCLRHGRRPRQEQPRRRRGGSPGLR